MTASTSSSAPLTEPWALPREKQISLRSRSWVTARSLAAVVACVWKWWSSFLSPWRLQAVCSGFQKPFPISSCPLVLRRVRWQNMHPYTPKASTLYPKNASQQGKLNPCLIFLCITRWISFWVHKPPKNTRKSKLLLHFAFTHFYRSIHKDDGEGCFKAQEKCELWFSVSSHLHLLDLTQKQEKKTTDTVYGIEWRL